MTDAPDWEGFGRDLMQDWPVGDVDGSELFDAALRNGLIREIPGGYDPEQHIDAECICPEAGDPWYEYAFGSRRDDLPATDAQADTIKELEAKLADVEAELHMMKTAGVIEVAVRNPSVSEYIRKLRAHWEARAEAAEAKLAEVEDDT